MLIFAIVMVALCGGAIALAKREPRDGNLGLAHLGQGLLVIAFWVITTYLELSVSGPNKTAYYHAYFQVHGHVPDSDFAFQLPGLIAVVVSLGFSATFPIALFRELPKGVLSFFVKAGTGFALLFSDGFFIAW